ncbi:hypothetical protein PORY_001288 [Pneumocystis oryctolagi]|uniref:Uncharacterized protein n=1 Tax=Pneumocystis oryctolagi TaxID=42067 RepID=A0ACB7CDS7_9ASCO|nr:hypothetical protein PORY_001288 [Pneumocystis oryctolagi]
MFDTVESLLSRILSRHRVQGLLIFEKTTDTIIQTTLSHETAILCAKTIKSLLNSAEILAENVSSTDVLQFIRIKMQMCELMIVPGSKKRQNCHYLYITGSEYLLVVMVST